MTKTTNAATAKTSLAAINNNITSLARRGKAFEQLLQKTLVMIAEHANGVGNGDVSAAARLMNEGLRGWVRRGPLCKYLEAYTPIVVTFKGGVAVAKLQEQDVRKPFDIAGMKAKPFWDFKDFQKDNELPFDSSDVDEGVIKMAERLEKRLKAGKILPTAVEHTKRIIAGLRLAVNTEKAKDAKPVETTEPPAPEAAASAPVPPAIAA